MKNLDNSPDIGKGKNQEADAKPRRQLAPGEDNVTPEVTREGLPPKFGMVAKSVAMGVAVSTLTQTGKSIAIKLLKNPIFLCGLGFTTGFLAHRYRREIVAAARDSAEHAKRFALRQKAHLENLMAGGNSEAP